VVALTEVTDFRQRIQRDDVEFVSLHKPPGQGLWQYPKLYRLFRRMRPDIVHTRNLAALECQFPAWAARVPVRIHGEHGRDVGDLDGSNRIHQRVRALLQGRLCTTTWRCRAIWRTTWHKVHVGADRITQIYNGVDTTCSSRPTGPQPIDGCPFDPARHWLVGTVGRMQTGQGPADAGPRLRAGAGACAGLRDRLRLVMVGDGPLRAQAQAVLDQRRRPIWPGCRASAATWRMSCVACTRSCCRRWPKASRTPSWKPWPAACR
jgi:glycosyltransferase involved in cell wall biosynthesis